MKLKKLKLMGVLALMVAFTFAMSACSGTGIEETKTDAHGIKVTVDVPKELVKSSGNVRVLEIEDYMTAEKIVVKLKDPENNDVLHRRKKDIDNQVNNEYEVALTEIEARKYDIEAELVGTIRDSKRLKTLYEGEKNKTIQPDTVVEAEVNVEPLDAESLTVNLDSEDSGVLENLEKVNLTHPEKSETITKEYDDNKSVEFNEEGFIPGRWILELKFKNTRVETREVLLLPTEEREITIDVVEGEEGKIEVSVNVTESPSAPDDVSIDDQGNLTWEGDAECYTVLFKEEDSAKHYEHVATVEGKEYSLLELKEGTYYIRAYNDSGYSSDVSDGEDKGSGSICLKGEFYETVQGAIDSIDSASSSATVYVGSGTYQEDVTVDVSGLTLKSVQQHEAVIEVPEAPDKIEIGNNDKKWLAGIYVKDEVENITIENFKINGNSYSQHKFAAILTNDADDITVKNCYITNLGLEMQTFGVMAKDSTLAVKNNKIEHFNRGGITIEGTGNAEIKGNRVIAPDNTTWAANGIQISYGATGTIEDNVVTNSVWEGPDWSATAILVYEAGDDGVEIQENTVLNSEIGIYAGQNTVSCEKNKVKNNEWGVMIDQTDVEITNNDFTKNEVHVYDYTKEADLNNILENNSFTPASVVYNNKITRKANIEVVNITQKIGYNTLQGAIEKAESNETIMLNSDINCETTIVLNKAGIVLDGNGHTLKYDEIGGGEEVIEAVENEVVVKNLTLANQSAGTQPSELVAKGEDITFKNNTVNRGVDGYENPEEKLPAVGNPAIIVGAEATETTVKNNNIDYGAIAADTSECTIKDNEMEWVISEGIWMYSSCTEEDAEERANQLVEDNTIEEFNAEGKAKVQDKNGNWQFSTN